MGRRLPAVVEAVRDGRLHLSGVLLLAPRLTEENQRAPMAEAFGRSKREVEMVVPAAGLGDLGEAAAGARGPRVTAGSEGAGLGRADAGGRRSSSRRRSAARRAGAGGRD